MWPFRRCGRVQTEEMQARDVFMNAEAFEREIEALAIGASGRVARGGVAQQFGRVLTTKKFAEEKEALKQKVSRNDYSF